MSKTILLVEDNPEDVFLTERALKKANIVDKMIVARDGVEALDYLFQRNTPADGDKGSLPDLVLLDLKLPRVNGLETLKQIRANPDTALVPVVMLTSSTEETDLAQAYQLGANSYVRKPVDFNQFVETIRNLGVYWLGLNRNPPQHWRKVLAA